MCGEKAAELRISPETRGSPPHVRGKGLTLKAATELGGITPACAGKSDGITLRRLVGRDHPRMCGEKARRNTQNRRHGGSPPHVRGKVIKSIPNFDKGRITPACAGKSTFLSKKHAKGRITPACAGKSSKSAVLRVSATDHPRMCGEKRDWVGFRKRMQGSPPHVRGKAEQSQGTPGTPRITPACAGKRRCDTRKRSFF